MTRVLHVCLLLLGISSLWTVCSAAEPCLGDLSSHERYSVNLIPRQPATQLFQAWAPLLMRLGKENGLCFDLNIPKNFPEFENTILTGTPDFTFLNPYHQIMVVHTPGYVPLIRDQQSGLAGILVVSKDSPIREIRQLEGKTVAFPAPNAYVASLLIRALLAREHINITPDYVGSHNNVYRAVAQGAVPAGGGANTTLNHDLPELRSQLRILFTTPFFIPHPFSAHPRVPQPVRNKVIKGFLKLYEDSEGRAMLNEIQIMHPVPADYVRDYQVLEELKLERFVE